jgi:hypothetical protein
VNIMSRRQQILTAIITINIISTWLHYTDNALYLDRYPGPSWFTTPGVFATVIIMTPIGLLGYWLYHKQSFLLSYLVLGVYVITSISSPGHYLFPMVQQMSLKMHALIWSDAMSGISLLTFIGWSGMIDREWQKVKLPGEHL